MARTFKNLAVCLLVLLSTVGAVNTLVPNDVSAKACGDAGGFFGFHHWYDGLGDTVAEKNGVPTSCVVNLKKVDGTWQTGVITIALNIVDILLRLIGIVAVIFIIIGGGRYITSQGNPASLTAAKGTIVRAITGLIIAIASVFILNYIAGTVFHLTVSNNNYQVSGGK